MNKSLFPAWQQFPSCLVLFLCLTLLLCLCLLLCLSWVGLKEGWGFATSTTAPFK